MRRGTRLPRRRTRSPRERHVPMPSPSAPKMCWPMRIGGCSLGQRTKRPLKAHFAAVRVRVADGPPQRIGDKGMYHMPGQEVWLSPARAHLRRAKMLSGQPPGRRQTSDAGCDNHGAPRLRASSSELNKGLDLDRFEGRSWPGLHRHALMTMVAYAFLQHRRLAAAAGGGKKSPTVRLNRRGPRCEKPSSPPWRAPPLPMPHCR